MVNLSSAYDDLKLVRMHYVLRLTIFFANVFVSVEQRGRLVMANPCGYRSHVM